MEFEFGFKISMGYACRGIHVLSYRFKGIINKLCAPHPPTSITFVKEKFALYQVSNNEVLLQSCHEDEPHIIR